MTLVLPRIVFIMLLMLAAQLGPPQNHRVDAPNSNANKLTNVSGVGTWYANGNGVYAAAGSEIRRGSWRGRLVRVCSGAKCIKVRLVDWCGCPGKRIIDLSPDAFREFAPLSKGVIHVTVSW